MHDLILMLSRSVTSPLVRGALARAVCRRGPRAAHPNSGGFTLIEVMVVMVLIAIIVSVVSVRFQRDDRQILREEALRLAALLTHARDEAITTGVPLGWRSDGNSYRFFRRGASRDWVALDRDDVLHAREIMTPMRLVEVQVGQGKQKSAAEAVKAETAPAIVFSPAAVNRPFRIVLELNGVRLQIRSDALSEIRVEDPSNG